MGPHQARELPQNFSELRVAERGSNFGADPQQAFLDTFAGTLPKGEHSAMVLSRAGWHGAKAIEQAR